MSYQQVKLPELRSHEHFDAREGHAHVWVAGAANRVPGSLVRNRRVYDMGTGKSVFRRMTRGRPRQEMLTEFSSGGNGPSHNHWRREHRC